ncbi:MULTISPECIES: phosphate ABC transporter permease PstA [Arthrobacter]|uniref:Phosphate transport system permease protein PstA n=1 Tax=Arthrobacter oryzae TaxID=409290 RepID=A0A3N0BM25_9MICC|nr:MULTISPECIES: phosphate ABC transporter permease PstA [Arthrobacter]QYF88742.1 phosphate ABC transporter permease PstA [Arthrobacter sp. PAMC25284]RNL49810.1 phosphate ABC transporter permease PstA [Arthrobacter oryzae]
MTSTLNPVRKRSALTKGQLPKWAPYAVLAAALVVGAAVLALIGFNAFGWGIVSAILFTAGLSGWSRVVEGSRRATDRLATCLVVGAFLIALLPLISVIWTVLINGLPGLLDPGFLTTSMNGVTGSFDNKSVEEGTPVVGGIYHAMLGTVQITLLATAISVPVGLLTSIYLVEYGNDRPLSRVITFFIDVMTGIPSIVAGLFAAAFFFAVVGPGTKTGAVAAVALSVLMIPVVVRSSEEMLKIVPNELREAAYALGVRKWRTILKVVIPTAISGIASGITLAIARVIGETAPILVTAGFATGINANVFSGWMASLPTFIYTQILNPTSPSNPDPSSQRAWGAALVLIILVMLLNLAARLVARVFAPKAGR